MRQMSHEKLKVYQKAKEFLEITAQVIDEIPRGNAAISDQLKRASLSIPLNIAEACGKTGISDNKRFFSIARGSAMECSAALDACKILKLANPIVVQRGKSLLFEIVSMLSTLTKKNIIKIDQDQNQVKAQGEEQA